MKVRNKILKPILFIAALFPLIRLVYLGFTTGLGANPVEVVTHETGLWTLKLLLITLAVSPLRKLTRQYWLIQYRRMIGLFAFFYAFLHFLTYIWLDQSFDVQAMVKDVYKRPFITAGFTAFVLLTPLALTSTKGWIQRLGKKWQQLHRLIYVSAAAGVFHFIWLVKKDIREPLIYGFLLAALLGYRMLDRILARRSKGLRTAPSVVSAD